MVAPQLTFEVITGPNFVSDYDIILDFGEKHLKMKQDEVIWCHEFFCNYYQKPETKLN
jgi:hypothetical protein